MEVFRSSFVRKNFTESDMRYSDLIEIPYSSSTFKGVKREGRGQLKLLIHEMQFLGMCWNNSEGVDTVYYAGAAPGQHIVILSKIFSSLKFKLYDVRDFHPGLRDLENVTCYQKLFSEECVDTEHLGKYILISDIRNLSFDAKKTDEENRDIVTNDWEVQVSWVKKTNPLLASLKLRINYPVYDQQLPCVSIPQGVICIQPWTKPGSGETRLIVSKSTSSSTTDQTDDELSPYIYEQKMFFHNMFKRVVPRYNVPDMKFLDDRYDSAFTYHILKSLFGDPEAIVNAWDEICDFLELKEDKTEE